MLDLCLRSVAGRPGACTRSTDVHMEPGCIGVDLEIECSRVALEPGSVGVHLVLGWALSLSP